MKQSFLKKVRIRFLLEFVIVFVTVWVVFAVGGGLAFGFPDLSNRTILEQYLSFTSVFAVTVGGSLYAVFGLIGGFRSRRTSFASPELDSLAQRMGAEPYLVSNRAKRYFKVRGLPGAASSKNRVFFGAEIYERFTEGKRLAVAAHEFVHIRERDTRYRFRHQALPDDAVLLVAVLVFGIAIETQFMFAALVVLLGSAFSFPALQVVLYWANSKTYREMELRCDREAIKFVDAQDLIDVLKESRALIPPRLRRGLRYKLASWAYPDIDERYEAIRRAAGLNQTSETA